MRLSCAATCTSPSHNLSVVKILHPTKNSFCANSIFWDPSSSILAKVAIDTTPPVIMAFTCYDFLILILTVIFPPFGVALFAGFGADLFLNVIFTMLGYLPGLIHGVYLFAVWVDRQYSFNALGVPRPAFCVFSTSVQLGEPTCLGCR
ncbi:hypothetical protein BGX38DRAFT_776196 [Terfezia claveryi]|nr:hypothetical protein BGX38DRAFT_776196 [Terfezia claveryi]